MDDLYLSRENRDNAFRLIPRGERKRFKRYSVRGQLLHPQYVVDWEQETGRTLTSADKGFGNTVYRTFFSVLYGLKTKESWE